MSERAAPFYCPYCGEEDLRPFERTDGPTSHGDWRCHSCQRAFALKYLGLTGGWGSTETTADTSTKSYEIRTGVTS